jgi:hypothetical protein
MKVILDGKEIEEGYICKYNDAYAHITGEVRFGEWIQDGSGGEYSGTPCYGYYVHVVDINPFEWDTDTKEEITEYYPDYLRNISLLKLLRNINITDLQIIKTQQSVVLI